MRVVAGGGKTCMLVPVKAVARNGGGVARGRRVDGQVQGYGAVATVGVATLEHMGVIAGSGKTRMLVPVITYTCHCRGVAHGRFVDGQVQGYRTVTTVGVATHEHMGVVAGSGKSCMLIPVEGYASDSGSVTRGRFIHHQCGCGGNAAAGSRFGHLQCVSAGIAGLNIVNGGILSCRSESGRTGPCVGHITCSIRKRALEGGGATSAHFIHGNLNLQSTALGGNTDTILVHTSRVHILHGNREIASIQIFKNR